jgi:peptidyl-dipeptidase A
MKLREKFGTDRIDADTPIPASLLGNMWAQTWENLYPLLAPYPDAGTVDVTAEMVKQGWNITRMFQEAENFYVSLGLEAMPTTYGPDSMIEKPDDGREVVCHASAWDFYDGQDFRIKMCTTINMDDLITVHHEQGHIQYYIQYKDQPVTFKEGANPGFHEAIGDVMALSVATPGHLNKIGLLPNFVESEQSDMNFLMRKALEKVVFMPFAFVMDRWRYGVFSGEYIPSNWTYSWHMLREKYQGLIPPVVRHADDFDPGAKYHIAADVEYSRYFVANVLQFQLQKELCVKAGSYDPNDPNKPLYRCDIYESPEAGSVMKTLLQAGSSKPWRETLMEAIGQDSMNASAILEFFTPLRSYLQSQLDANQETVGWRSRFEEFIEAEDTTPNSETTPPTMSSELTTSDTGSETTATTTSSETTGSTEDNGGDDPGPVDNTVPIVVGSVLGALVVAVIIAYFIGRRVSAKKDKKKQERLRQEQLEQGQQRPPVVGGSA